MTSQMIETAGSSRFGELSERLPGLLRLLGGGALLVAMYSFLFQGWQSGNDIYRYLILLGHTSLLAAIGLMSGHWLQESKGARLLISLALVSVPVNFAVLGAFIYSQVQSVSIAAYPGYVAWTVGSLEMALGSTAGAMLILAPLSLLGFTVLARSLSKKLTLLFLLSNAVLLVPVRDAHIIGMLVMLLGLLVAWLSHKIANQQVVAKTANGLLALGLQFLPLAILMGRSLWLYAMDLYLLTMLAFTVFILLRQTALLLSPMPAYASLLNKLAVLPAIAVAPLLTMAIYETIGFAEVFAMPLAAAVTGLMVLDISRRESSPGGYQKLAGSLFTLGLLLNLSLFSQTLSALICTLGGLLILVMSFKLMQKQLFLQGVLLILAGLGQQLLELVQHFDFTSWAGLAVFGVLAIVIASMMESQSQRFRPFIEQWKKAYRHWN